MKALWFTVGGMLLGIWLVLYVFKVPSQQSIVQSQIPTSPSQPTQPSQPMPPSGPNYIQNAQLYVWPSVAPRGSVLPPLETVAFDNVEKDGEHILTLPGYMASTVIGGLAPGQHLEINRVEGRILLSPTNLYYVSPLGGLLPTDLLKEERPEEYPHPNIRVGAFFVDNGRDTVAVTSHASIPVIKDSVVVGIHSRLPKYDIKPSGSFIVHYKVGT